MTVFEPPQRHSCSPPRHRPKAEWRTVPPPLAWMKPEARATAKPMPVPTPYPLGTVWRCACGRLWHAVSAPPPPGWRGGYPGGSTSTHWRPVRWYHRRLLREAAIGDARRAYEAAAQVVSEYEESQ